MYTVKKTDDEAGFESMGSSFMSQLIFAIIFVDWLSGYF